MKVLGHAFRDSAQTKPVSAKSTGRKTPRNNTTRDCPRVTLRLSVDDHARLQDLANGMALSTYIRAQALGEALPRRKTKLVASVADKQALAQILGLLGQSRIANNLNQLAYHANVGSLEMDDEAQAQIEEAYDNVLFLRQSLMKALGVRG
jgi:Bacterial mobilisation protein (MobC)